MKEQHTYVKYTRSELDALPDETGFGSAGALTDEAIDAAVSSDPDDPPTDASFWKDAIVVMPENMIIVDADYFAFMSHFDILIRQLRHWWRCKWTVGGGQKICRYITLEASRQKTTLSLSINTKRGHK